MVQSEQWFLQIVAVPLARLRTPDEQQAVV